MANPTEDDLKVADSVLMNTMLPTQLHGLVRSRTASAIAAEREKAAKIASCGICTCGPNGPVHFGKHYSNCPQGIAAAIRAGDKE